jgi:hypothetical protein
MLIKKVYVFLYLFLEIDDEELVNECDVVSRVVAVPDRQEDESSGLTHESVVEEPEPLVDVRHHPRVRVDVEAVDQLKKPNIFVDIVIGCFNVNVKRL